MAFKISGLARRALQSVHVFPGGFGLSTVRDAKYYVPQHSRRASGRGCQSGNGLRQATLLLSTSRRVLCAQNSQS